MSLTMHYAIIVYNEYDIIFSPGLNKDLSQLIKMTFNCVLEVDKNSLNNMCWTYVISAT